MTDRRFTEDELPKLAKKLRIAAGRTRSDAAKELNVSRPAIFNAEEKKGAKLLKLRKRIIEKYSGCTLTGPEYRLIDR